MWRSLGWDALRPHLARTKFQANSLFRESIIYPEEACREALINAIAHHVSSVKPTIPQCIAFYSHVDRELH